MDEIKLIFHRESGNGRIEDKSKKIKVVLFTIENFLTPLIHLLQNFQG